MTQLTNGEKVTIQIGQVKPRGGVAHIGDILPTPRGVREFIWNPPDPPIARRGERSHEDRIANELARLSREVTRLSAVVSSLAQASVTYLSAFENQDFMVSGPIPVTIEPDDDGYAATWVQAGLAGYGMTPSDAMASLEAELIEVYEACMGADETNMGRIPRRWRALLPTVMTRR